MTQCGAAMPTVPENIPLGERSQSLTSEQLTPYTESTVFSLSHNDWALRSTTTTSGACEFYRHAIFLMTTGGSVLAAGVLLSGLYFGGVFMMAANILGPALLSIGLMVLVIGVVLVPITREMKQSSFKKVYSCYQPQYHL